MKRFRWSDASRTWVLEVFSIVFVITLAFFVNEWRETSARNAKAQAAMASIQRELQSNLDDLTQMIPRHEAFRDSLYQSPPEPQALLRRVMMLGGISGPGITSASWDAALSSNAAASFDYELLRVMSLIQDFQQANMTFIDKIANLLYAREALLPAEAHTQTVILRAILTDWIIAERTLMGHYEQALMLLDEALN